MNDSNSYYSSQLDPEISSSVSRPYNRHTLLSWFHGLLILSSAWYCYQVFGGAAEACYVLPCYEGPGLQALWKVNKGVTFTGESSGVFSLAHALVGWWLVTYHKMAHAFVMGVLAGCTLCASLLSWNMIWVWGAEWNLLGDLTLLNPNNTIFEESGRHMIINRPLISVFQQLFYLSVAMCALQSGVLIQFLVNGSTWIRTFRIRAEEQTSSLADELTPLQRT
ncbi:hypothetical protein IV203_021157 [Nitzschia inconspicua]|uniref:Uncharacterized protein n=1 Tax=Nitzschia inconspicua TaxID=303405 RepID=A0A9K3PD10_9STRA|nr:hypothetical protein IV203_021157 [Nitzschia inconspicua]